jgi:D-glycero-D-manno-heptose 1,7-bisphosphate phosphatase
VVNGRCAAVFFDRDGTLNRAVIRDGRSYPPDTIDAFELYPGVPDAVRRLKAAGYLIVVVTNQPDVATGRQSRAVVDAIHDRLRALVPIDDLRTCFHVDADRCRCRKPQPGMLLDAAADHAIDLDASYMIGDRWRDVEAGKAAGCRTIFIRNDYDERQPDGPDAAVDSVVEASAIILAGAL